jgi:CRISPR/Cas system-associated endonuclease Cas3-HD
MSLTAPLSTLPLFACPEPELQEDATIEAQFRRFNALHPAVYDELVRLCREGRAAGMERVGIGMLWEVLRWKTQLRGLPALGEAFKLNNNYRSRYARLIMEREPDLADIFETRELQSA